MNDAPGRTSTLSRSPIGVFDSGIGGLTVVAALKRTLPGVGILYLGDTARVPYGGKSPETVTRYSREIISILESEGASLIVAACNTASALAVPELAPASPLPLIGVITPGAEAAVRATRSGRIGVIGTKATVGSGAYRKGIHALNPDLEVIAVPCPLLVPLIEEGLLEDSVTETILRRYLEPMLEQGIDTLVLGCTHYPLVKGLVGGICGPEVALVDSAENCALAVKKLLIPDGTPADRVLPEVSSRLDVLLTDSSEGFLRIAERSLDLSIDSLELRRVAG